MTQVVVVIWQTYLPTVFEWVQDPNFTIDLAKTTRKQPLTRSNFKYFVALFICTKRHNIGNALFGWFLHSFFCWLNSVFDVLSPSWTINTFAILVPVSFYMCFSIVEINSYHSPDIYFVRKSSYSEEVEKCWFLGAWNLSWHFVHDRNFCYHLWNSIASENWKNYKKKWWWDEERERETNSFGWVFSNEFEFQFAEC